MPKTLDVVYFTVADKELIDKVLGEIFFMDDDANASGVVLSEFLSKYHATPEVREHIKALAYDAAISGIFSSAPGSMYLRDFTSDKDDMGGIDDSGAPSPSAAVTPVASPQRSDDDNDTTEKAMNTKRRVQLPDSDDPDAAVTPVRRSTRALNSPAPPALKRLRLRPQRLSL